MQSLCQTYAVEFNARQPAKKVEFIDSFIIELTSRKCNSEGMRGVLGCGGPGCDRDRD